MSKIAKEYEDVIKQEYKKGQVWQCQGGCSKKVQILEDCKGPCGFLMCCSKPMKLVK